MASAKTAGEVSRSHTCLFKVPLVLAREVGEEQGSPGLYLIQARAQELFMVSILFESESWRRRGNFDHLLRKYIYMSFG